MTLSVNIPRDEQAPAKARAAVRDLDPAIHPDLLPDMTLLISELVSNTVKYGSEDDVRLEILASDRGTVRVVVGDDGVGFVPVPRDRPATEVGGWGLHLVEQLTDRWGMHEGSARVWFEMSRGNAPGAEPTLS